MRHMAAFGTVHRTSLEINAELLVLNGHTVRVFIIDGVIMKAKRVKAEKHIFEQCKEGNTISFDASFNQDVVDISNIDESGRYYGVLLFVSHFLQYYLQKGPSPAAADATHCDGVGPQSYEPSFEVVTYDANMHLLPIVFWAFSRIREQRPRENSFRGL